MTLKHRTIRTILRLYPASWRAEYGDELHDVLMARPLSLAVLIDVAWNGVVPAGAVASRFPAVCGLAGMTAALIALVWNIVAPSSSWYAVSNLLRPSEITLPTIKFSDAASNVFIPLLLVCGASIQMRHCGPPRSVRMGPPCARR